MRSSGAASCPNGCRCVRSRSPGALARFHRRPASARDGRPPQPSSRRGSPARTSCWSRRSCTTSARDPVGDHTDAGVAIADACLSADGVSARRRRDGRLARRAPSAPSRCRVPPRRRRPGHRASRGERGRVDRAAPLARGAHGSRRCGHRGDGVGSVDRPADRRARRPGRAPASRVEGGSRSGDHVPDAGPVGAPDVRRPADRRLRRRVDRDDRRSSGRLQPRGRCPGHRTVSTCGRRRPIRPRDERSPSSA